MFNIAKQATKVPLDVHLMVENPIKEIEKYKGAVIITFHVESVNESEILKVVKAVRNIGAKVGISVKPNTSISILTNLLTEVDLVLIMTVEPGYGGQKLIDETLDKIDELRALGYNGLVEVDGGVTIENSKEIIEKDVDIIVAGTAIFSANNEIEAIKKMKSNVK